MAKKSAGILLYRRRDGRLEVFLVHPGGPYWKNKDEGAWMIPKGEIGEEEPIDAARREFEEETGFALSGPFQPLEPIVQSGGKQVLAWAVEGNLEAAAIQSNSFEMEWPPRSGRRQSFPEVDRAGWFDLPAARRKMLKSQLPLLDQLEGVVGGEETPI